jgi:cell division protein FtsZ
MTLNLSIPGQEQDLKPRITVFGVGGAGGNAVNNMIEKQLDGVEFVVANTDAQALAQSRAEARIQMGVKATEGLGAGARPQVGATAAEETIEEIIDHLAGAHMCFITAGMGGGTGTGAAPIIAQAARELGVLTVGVVTKPFQFEGNKRMKQAEDGIEALQKVVDTLIIIPNQNLFRLANERTTFTEAFALADDVLYQGVKGVTDLMVRPGLINLDFADVRAVMDEMGKAMMGTGEGDGEDRARMAAEKAIANPLLDEISLNGAKGVLINITGGHDLTLFELDEAANIIRDKVDQDANIIVGSTLDPDMEGRIRVSVVATGIDASAALLDVPVPRRRMGEPLVNPVERDHQPAFEPRRPAAASAPVFEPRRTEEAPAARRYEPEEPTLFQDLEAEDAVEDYQDEIVAQDEPELADDLPAPAYQPAQRRAASPQDPAASFVAPKARPAGTPSPEALARLQAAVKRVPQQESRTAQPQAQPQPGDRQPRFGINSLINRMTGHAGEPAKAVQPPMQPPVQRRQPPVQAASQAEEDLSPEQERIEIPAFLRRQAN